jgi:hypothetical protein
MSYDLAFWQQESWMSEEPGRTYEALVSGAHVPGLATIPIEGMLADLLAAFPGAVREPNGMGEWVIWISPNGQDMFEVAWSEYYMSVSCRHVHSDDKNRIIEVGIAHGCPLFDPQIGERFRFDAH